jgi:NAD(P)-dependent dehydrogenase (short-subunit alcohol dehydrogenase family)
MRGKTVVITGGTSGIGEVAAIELAKMGARIVLVARDNARGNATLARLRHSAPGIAHSAHFADLLRLAEMKRVADQIAEQESRIDVLINNAGALFASGRRALMIRSSWNLPMCHGIAFTFRASRRFSPMNRRTTNRRRHQR